MKEQLLAGLPESSFEIIELTANLHWKEKGKEFLLNGQMYDVAKTKQVNGKTLLYCLNDNKEKQLLLHLAKTVKSGSENNNEKGGSHIVKFQLSDFTAHKMYEPALVSYTILQQYHAFDDALLSSFKEIIAPPPRA